MKRILKVEEIENIINLYNQNFGIRKIYKLTGISPNIIERHLRERNVYIEPSKYKYSVKHDIFNKIDSEEKAYWLGFLFTDGCVRKKKHSYELKLKLSIKDLDHLEKYKKFLESSHIIVKNISKVKYPKFISISENVSLSVYSKQIFDDLNEKGCTPNKTYRLSKPNIDEIYYRDFIRGYFDGDGYVGQNREKTNKSVVFVSSSEMIIEWINEILNSNINTTFQTIKKNKNTYRLSYQDKTNITKMYEFMYYPKVTTFLLRKKLKYDEVISSFTKISVTQLKHDGTVVKLWDDVVDASINMGIKKTSIIECCEGKINTLKGYKWVYTQ